MKRILLAVLSVVVCSAGASAEPWVDFDQQFVVPTPLGIVPGWLDISGPWVVYEGGDQTVFPVPDPEMMIIIPEMPVDVYAYNRNTTLTTRVTTTRRYQGIPAVHNGYVVWTDARVENQLNIWGMDLDRGGEAPISAYPTGQFQPDVSDRYVVWADARRGVIGIQDIWGYDRQTGEEFQVAQERECLGLNLPRVSGSTAVMTLGTPPGINPPIADVAIADLGERRWALLTNEPGIEIYPVVSGNTVIWKDFRGGDQGQIWAMQLPGSQQQMLADGVTGYPDFDGRYVVWWDLRYGNWDIFAYDLLTGTEFQVSNSPDDEFWPRISGDTVVWNTYIRDPDTQEILAMEIRGNTIVPEPATLSLLALGGLALISRRR